MEKVVKLAFSFLIEHPGRMLLTTLATTAATCMVLWVATSYEALRQTYDEYADLALGTYELAIAPISMNREDVVPASVAEELKKDPAVAFVDSMWAVTLRLPADPDRAIIRAAGAIHRPNDERKGPGRGPQAILPQLELLATNAVRPPFEILEGSWIDIGSHSEAQLVLRADVARRRQVAIGDRIVVENARSGVGPAEIEVIGIVNAPTVHGAGEASLPILAPSSGQAFMSVAAAEQLLGETARASLLGISVHPEADINQFRFGWSPRLSRFSTPVQFQQAFEIEEALDQAAAAQNVRMQSYAATAVAMLAAMLVIFCTLSMGVTQRIRQYAILRAVVLTRQEIGWLIVLEGVVLGGLGLCSGLMVGWIVLTVLSQAFSEHLYHGIQLGSHSVGLAIFATLGGGVVASIVPAYRAMRVKPIDAMAPSVIDDEGRGVSKQALVIGGLLMLVNPVLAFLVPATESRIVINMVVGFVSMSIGFVLIAPAVVLVVDRWFAPILSRLLRVDPKLLASQITTHLWRTVGAAITIAFGMGLFVGIQVWGLTMLQAFIPGAWVPDAIVHFKAGSSDQQRQAISKLPSVDTQRCLPIVAEQPRLMNDPTDSAERATVTRQDNVVLVGIDPNKAFAGNQPLFEFEWIAGDLGKAVTLLKDQRGCLVPDHFLREAGLGIGDEIVLVPPNRPGRSVSYTIAGAVRLPGWHWQTKLTGLRNRTHRAAALVFADYDFVASDFRIKSPTHLWLSYSQGAKGSKAEIGEQLRSEVEAIFRSALVAKQNNEQTEFDSGVHVIPVQTIRDHLGGTARRWIWLISQVPLVSMLIASLGVSNVLLASVRSRRWEFGVLRSIGFTSSDLVRTILAEGILIGVVASLLSVGFGILAGWCGCGLAQTVSFFGGLHPPLTIPWASVFAGIALVVGLTTLCAVWPAVSIGRTRPLKLLQANR